MSMLKNFLLSIFSLFLVFLFLEINIRIYSYNKKNEKDIIEQYICQYDSLLGWRGIPGYYDDFCGLFNSKGFRDREHSVPKSPYKKRILILGDSFAWGFNVRDSDSFPRVLQNMLGENYEILSFAVPGYGTDQELL